MGAYAALGTSSLIPLLHGVQLYGLEYMLRYAGMKWYLLELAFYGSGVGLYAVCLPQASTACHALDLCKIQAAHRAGQSCVDDQTPLT